MNPFRLEPLERRVLLTVVPGGFTEAAFAPGLTRPTAMAFAPDGRLFVNEQDGAVRVVKGGQLLPAPFATLPVDSAGERGLLGVALDPAFDANGFVYVYWTTTSPVAHNRVSRFTAAGDVAAADSRVDLFDLPALSTATNHNGGAIHFGPDGKLYVGVGENGNAPNSQSLATTLGKLLRINPDGSIPADNPLVAQTTGTNGAIWATGLRNPFTFAFQPDSGRLFINDVGQGTFEEVNDGAAGANYGWPNNEGPTTDPNTNPPLYAYGRGAEDTNGAAITGGTFYNPPASQFPADYTGTYFFADYKDGYISRVDPADAATALPFATNVAAPVDLAVGPDGGLYALTRGDEGTGSGQVLRYAATAVGDGTGPDLVPTLADPPPALVVGEERGKVAVRVSNGGTETATGPVTIRLLLSADAAPDAGDVAVASVTKKLRLPAGKAKTVSFKFDYPDLDDGTFLLLAEVDPANTVIEASDANNLAVGGPINVRKAAVDFSGTFPATAPPGVSRGGKGSVVLTVFNAGNVAASGPLRIDLFASTDNTGSAGATALGTTTKRVTIKPGSRKPVVLRFNVPSDLPAGTYFFSAAIDPAHAFTDSDETDNLAVASVPVTVE